MNHAKQYDRDIAAIQEKLDARVADIAQLKLTAIDLDTESEVINCSVGILNIFVFNFTLPSFSHFPPFLSLHQSLIQ